MSKISIEKVEEISKLARLELNGAEKEKYREDLSSILVMVEKIDTVDVDNLQVIDQVSGLKNVLRDDEIKKSDLKREELLKNAPETKEGFIKVKKVLE